MTERTNNALEEVIVHVLSVLTEKQIHKLTLFNKLHTDEEILAWRFWVLFFKGLSVQAMIQCHVC